MNMDSCGQLPDPAETRSADRFACLSAKSRSAIATIWISGGLADAALDRYFHSASKRRAKDMRIGKIAFGSWHSGKSLTPIDAADETMGEDVVVCRVRPDEIEVHCHGGVAAQQAICQDLSALGMSEISWMDWEQIQAGHQLAAEALASLRCATTHRTAAILLDQLHGAFEREIVRTQDSLAANDLPQAERIIDALLQKSAIGRHLVHAFQIVIAGRPNVGKSSLINCLLGYQRAIVFDQPGTTRDVVTGKTALDGWPVEFSDTAGIRSTGDKIEIEGVRRAMQAAAKADLLVLVFDRAAEWTADEQKLLEEYPSALVVFNKCDIAPADQTCEQTIARIAAAKSAVCTIATEPAGISQLIEAIVQRLVPTAPAPGAAVPYTDRQIQLLEEAAAAMKVQDREKASMLCRRLRA